MAMLPTSFRSSRLFVATALGLAALLAAPLRAQTAQPSLAVNRITAVIDESNRVTLKGTVHPLANAANDRGAAPDSMPLQRLHLVLKRSPAQEATLWQLISDLHTPGSASYHKWLTPEQFGEQFGPADQDIATIESWLASHRFQVGKVQPGKQVIEFSGNVAQMRDAFHTQIHKYVVRGETHHANASAPQIPSALAPVVGGFVALNNFRLKHYIRVLGKATYNTQTHTAKPEWTYGNSSGVQFVLAPADYAKQYDLSPLYTAGTNGSNQAIAIVNDSNINIDLANQFRSAFGLSANPPQVIIDGNDPGIDGINNPDGPNFDSIEAYLDVEWSAAVAPAATVDLVIAADTALESGLILAAEHAVFGNIAPILSLSFGDCEAGLGSTNAFLNYLWEQAAAQGITVMVSTGDSGSAGCDDDNSQYYAVDGLAVNGFASTPYNVAVGGTDFYYSDYNNPALLNTQLGTYWNTTPTLLPQASLLQVIPEQPWNDSQYGLNAINYYTDISGSTATTIASGSGGASSCGLVSATTGTCTGGYAKPSWQTGTGVPADGVRDLPDVSLYAADGLNYSFYPICASYGDCQAPSGGNLIQITGVGGTSASAPSFAGIMALVNQSYGRQGQANFVLYPLKMQFPAAFHDVTHGTNSVPCAFSPSSPNCIAVSNPITVTDPFYGTAEEGQIGSGATPDYNATAGFNLATGLGTIDANVLVTDWASIRFASTAVNLTSPTAGTTITHGSSVTFTGTVTETAGATPTGNVAIETDSTEPVNQGQGFFPLSGGSFSGSINYLPGGTYSVWANYGGDTSNASSASPKAQITVNPEASSTYFNILNVATPSTVTVAINPGTTNIPYGTQLILAAEPFPTTYYNQCVVNPTPPASCNTPSFTFPTGTVIFADNGTTINTAVVNAEGDAEYNAPWSVGSHSATARYSGDASYNASSASAITFSIAKDTPTVSLSGATQTPPTVFTIQLENSANLSNEIHYGIPFSNPAAAPTGNITVSGFPAGVPTSANLSAAVDPLTYSPEGVATITAPAGTAAGTYTVTINYIGDSNYSAASNSFTVTILAPPGNFTATGSAASATAGGSANSTITVTPSGGFTGTVAVTCPAATLPPGVSCSPSPLNITMSGSGAATGQLTVNVAAPSAPGTTAELLPATRTEYAGLQGGPTSRNGWWKLSAGTGLAAIFLIFVPGRRRYRTAMGLWLVCLLSFAMGCGGSSSSVGPVAVATTTKITAPVTKAAQGTSLSFNISVTASGLPAGSGMAQLFDGATALGAPVQAVNGAVTINNNTLIVGTHAISAHYLGDASTQASQSGTVNVTVTGNTTVGISTAPASSNGNVSINLTVN